MAAAEIISIQSQHFGNCASDTIQIIMFFADGYKEYFRALARYLHHPGIPLPEGNNVVEYLTTSAKRYLTLGGVNARTRTRSASPMLFPGINSGVKCSKHIGAFLHRPNLGTSSFWEYRKDDYDLFTKQLFNYAKALKVHFNLFSLPNPDICISDIVTSDTVAVQFFTMNISNSAFHTFCIVRHDGRWYIGDNMLGFLFPAANITIDNFNRYRIGVNDTRNADGMYTRHYIWYNISDSSIKFTIAEIKRTPSQHIGVYSEPYLENLDAALNVRGRLCYNFGPVCVIAAAAGAAAGGAGARARANHVGGRKRKHLSKRHRNTKNSCKTYKRRNRKM